MRESVFFAMYFPPQIDRIYPERLSRRGEKVTFSEGDHTPFQFCSARHPARQRRDTPAAAGIGRDQTDKIRSLPNP